MPYADPAKNAAAKKRYAESARAKEMQRKNYLAKRQEIIQRSGAWAAAHPDEARAGARRRYAENIEKERERSRRKSCAYRRADPAAHVTRFAKYRTRKLGNESPGVTTEQWGELLDMFGHRCAYCLQPGKLEREHVIAIVLGGLDETDNIVPACHTCNTRKRDRTMLEWALIGGATGGWVKSRRRRAVLTGRNL